MVQYMKCCWYVYGICREMVENDKSIQSVYMYIGIYVNNCLHLGLLAMFNKWLEIKILTSISITPQCHILTFQVRPHIRYVRVVTCRWWDSLICNRTGSGNVQDFQMRRWFCSKNATYSYEMSELERMYIAVNLCSKLTNDFQQHEIVTGRSTPIIHTASVHPSIAVALNWMLV